MRNFCATLLALIVTASAWAIDINGNITSGGAPRSFILHAPGSQVAQDLPVVLVLHGDGGTGAGIKGYSGFDAVADASGFMAVYPNSANTLGNGIWNKSVDGNYAGEPDDVLFISELVDYLCTTYGINPKKVYVTGHSGGGFMAYHLAVELNNKIAAVAPVAANMYGDNAYLTQYFQSTSFVKVPICHLHGDADNVVAYPDPNHVPDAWSEWPLTAFSYPTCASNTYQAAAVVDLVAGVKRITYCPAGSGNKEISLIRFVGGGHGWPAAAGFNAAQYIWNFFNTYELPTATNCAGTPSTSGSTLTINGKYLQDDCGENIVLRGVNHGNVYAVNLGVGETAEIGQTKSNVIRLGLERTFQDWSNGGAVTNLTPAHIEPILQSCLQNKMIPVVTLHDFTGAGAATSLPAAVTWWTSPGIKDLMLEYEEYLVLNLANEPDNSNYPPNATEQTAYYNANKSAILSLRAAGYTCPIMIDGMHWGKDHTFFLNHGAQLLLDDPLHKLQFSIHAYWPTSGPNLSVSDVQMGTILQSIGTSGLPFVFGELAKSEVSNNIEYAINYQLLMQLCHQYDLGFMVWWWGFANNPGVVSPLEMTPDGLYAGLEGAGEIMAVTGPHSIANTAVRPYKLVNGNCLVGIDEDNISQINIFPNPAAENITITGLPDSQIPTVYALYDMQGRIVYSMQTAGSQVEMSLESIRNGIYLLMREGQPLKRIIVSK